MNKFLENKLMAKTEVLRAKNKERFDRVQNNLNGLHAMWERDKKSKEKRKTKNEEK